MIWLIAYFGTFILFMLLQDPRYRSIKWNRQLHAALSQLYVKKTCFKCLSVIHLKPQAHRFNIISYL